MNPSEHGRAPALLVASLERRFGPPRRFGHSLFWSVRSQRTQAWQLDLWLDLVPDRAPSALLVHTKGRRAVRSEAHVEALVGRVHAAIAV